MPHKHRRSKVIGNTSTANLPPTILAKPLPATNSSGIVTELSLSPSRKFKERKKRKGNTAEDDTPKAFLRLMSLAKTGKFPNGLDDGAPKPSRKRKSPFNEALPAATKGSRKEVANADLTIRPSEKLSEFSARVDQQLPVSGLVSRNKGRKVAGAVGERNTKHTRKLQKMQREWHEEEERRKEKRKEAEEERIELEAGMGLIDGDAAFGAGGKKRKRKRKKTERKVGASDVVDEDPWARLKAARGEERRGLNDVVKAPPVFTNVPREKFKELPKKTRSLKENEDLGMLREGLVENYRQIMAGRRGVNKDT